MSVFTESSHITRPAGADLSAAQYKIVKQQADRSVILATAATDILLGIVATAPLYTTVGAPTDVKVRNGDGTFKVMLGSTVAVGDALTTNGAGLAITTTTAGNQLIGYAQEAGVVNQIIEVTLNAGKY